jgi:sigma-E factor negative regulatory protein RseC
MLTERGRVVAIEEGALWIETLRQSVCGSCSANKGCGHGLLNRLGDGRSNLLRISLAEFPQDRFAVDDDVLIAIPEQLLLRSSFTVYGLPLVSTLLGAATAPSLLAPGSELVAVAGALCGFAAGVGLVRLHAWRHREDSSLQPRLLGPATEAGGARCAALPQGT